MARERCLEALQEDSLPSWNHRADEVPLALQREQTTCSSHSPRLQAQGCHRKQARHRVTHSVETWQVPDGDAVLRQEMEACHHGCEVCIFAVGLHHRGGGDLW